MKDILKSEVPVSKNRNPTSVSLLVAGFSMLVPAMGWSDIYIWAEESGGNTTISFSGSFEASTLDGQDDKIVVSNGFFGSPNDTANVRGSGGGIGNLGSGSENGIASFTIRWSDNAAINPPGIQADLDAITPDTGNVSISADTSSGDSFSLDFDVSNLDFLLPANYVPGTIISGSSTWLGKSLADLGFSSTARVDVIIKGPLGEKIVYFGKPPVSAPAVPDNSAAKAELSKKIAKLKKKLKNAKRKKQVAKAKKFKKQIKKLTKQLRAL